MRAKGAGAALAAMIVAAIVPAGAAAAATPAPAPFEYTIASTVTIVHDGVYDTQTLISRCRSLPPAKDGFVRMRRYGDAHGFRLPGNGIGVLDNLDLCFWSRPPAVGREEVNQVSPSRAAMIIFDDVRNPTRATRRWVTTGGGALWPEDIRIAQVRVIVVPRQPLSRTLDDAFPGLRKTGARAFVWRDDLGATPRPGVWIGQTVQVYRTAIGPPCVDPAGPAVVVIEREDLCRPPRRSFGLHGDPNQPSMAWLGHTGLEPSADFAVLTLADERPSHTLPPLYDPRLILRAGAPRDADGAWNPTICFRSLCVRPKRSSDAVRFYVPKEELLVSVVGRHETVSPNMFSAAFR